jgi:uncharacterized protein (TIGR00299 family) protein
MPTLLIEMPCGVAGDMLLAALADLGGDIVRAQHDLLALGIGEMRIAATRVSVNGISALRAEVDADQEALWSTGDPGSQPHGHQHDHDPGHRHGHAHDHQHAPDTGHHHAHDPEPTHPAASSAAAAAAGVPRLALPPHQPHRPYRVIRDLIAAAALPARVRERAQRVFRVLAEAEGQVHGVPYEAVEFHEVGAVDAIADVVGCCLLLEQLGVTRIISSPLTPGTGSVVCAHGRMPVPVPAVAAMLAQRQAPWRQLADETGELTTPTGCALVTALADAYLHPGTSQVLTTRRVGYGAGHRRIPGMTNAVRLSLVDELDESGHQPEADRVAELCCNFDDATGEQLAVLLEELLAAGAKDACLMGVAMKKGRPGQQLTVLCDPLDLQRIASLVLSRSPTIGVRHRLVSRLVLPRRAAQVLVEGQRIALKVVTLPDGSERAKPEAEGVQAAARALGRDFASIQQAALAAWRGQPAPAPAPPPA